MERRASFLLLLLLCLAMPMVMADLNEEDVKEAATTWSEWTKDKLSDTFHFNHDEKDGDVVEKVKISVRKAAQVDIAEKNYIDAKKKLEHSYASTNDPSDQSTFEAEKTYKEAKEKLGDAYAQTLQGDVVRKTDNMDKDLMYAREKVAKKAYENTWPKRSVKLQGKLTKTEHK